MFYIVLFLSLFFFVLLAALKNTVHVCFIFGGKFSGGEERNSQTAFELLSVVFIR